MCGAGSGRYVLPLHRRQGRRRLHREQMVRASPLPSPPPSPRSRPRPASAGAGRPAPTRQQSGPGAELRMASTALSLSHRRLRSYLGGAADDVGSDPSDHRGSDGHRLHGRFTLGWRRLERPWRSAMPLSRPGRGVRPTSRADGRPCWHPASHPGPVRVEFVAAVYCHAVRVFGDK